MAELEPRPGDKPSDSLSAVHNPRPSGGDTPALGEDTGSGALGEEGRVAPGSLLEMRGLGPLGLPSPSLHPRRSPRGSRTQGRARGPGPGTLSHVSQLPGCDVTSRLSGSSAQILGRQSAEWSRESSPNTVDAASVLFTDRTALSFNYFCLL